MSYQELLSQYADKMNRSREHAEDINAENREMKANSLEKAFEHITGPIQQGSEGVAALSGAYMAGRKVYKKVLQNRAARAAAKASAKANSEGDSTSSSTNAADGEGDGSPSGGGEGGATGGQGADGAAPRAAADDPAPASISETGTSGASAGPSETLSSIPEEPTVIGGARTQDRVLSEAQESDPAGISDQGAARQAAQKANTATDEAPNSSGTQGTGAEAEPAAPQGAEGTPVTQPAQAAEGDTLAGTGRTTAADLTSTPGSGDPFSSPRTLAQTSEGAEGAEDSTSLLSRAQGAISSARNAIQGAGNGIKNAVSGAKQALAGAGEDAATTLTEGGADLAASQSLDWLGPIGLGIGAIGGLVDLFENLFGKPKTAEDLSGPLQTGTAAGIDTESLESKAPASVAT